MNRCPTLASMSTLCVAGLAVGAAHAQLTFNPVPPTLSHSSNLVVNGSFEIGAPSYGMQIPWAVGPTGGPNIPPGWAASGTASTYATWGSDGVAGQGIRSSAPLPDGQSGLYFGNLFTDVSTAPIHQPDGRVTFASTPVFTPQFGAPVILSQTVNTQLSPAPMYQLTFWVSGEDAVQNSGWLEGVMGFRMTNVLPGDPIQYLTIPSGSSTPNARLFAYDFVPINPLLPCTIEFINWGHVTTIAGNNTPFTSELVLDDVIINAVPTPGAAVVLGLGGLIAAKRRRA